MGFCYFKIIVRSPATMAEESNVKGTAEFAKQAEAGLKLLQGDAEAVLDVPGATAHKEDVDAQIAAMDLEIAALSGKDNKKARTAKEKEKAALKVDPKYIDACKVVKGLQPPNGNFATKEEKAAPTKEEAPQAADAKADAKSEKEKKAPKKTESAGISKAERDELEKLKTQIIDRKKELKEGGMSGGQINKDEQVVAWVTRMNELKEKECPGATTAKKDDDKDKKKGKKLDSAQQKLVEEKEKELEEYELKLKTEFKYSKKEIAADPDYMEMKAALAKMKK